MKSLRLEKFGPIARANVTFGDLTILVGAQATGKSLFVQLVKALQDDAAVRNDLKTFGFDWLHGDDLTADYCSLYFGGGFGGVVGPKTQIVRDGKTVDFHTVAKPGGRKSAAERVFLIPAHRVLVLGDGWPRPFMGYAAGDPYCMRRFSETLRLFVEPGVGPKGTVFPHPSRLKSGLKEAVDQAIYGGATVSVHTEGSRRRLVLTPEREKAALPYGAWSAGQREFTPLLLGLYWLMPPAKVARRAAITTVIVEEPEMGLHPRAIMSFGLLVLELLHRDYQVIVSTHSPILLDLVWAVSSLKGLPEKSAVAALKRIFGIQTLTANVRDILVSSLHKSYRTYVFEQTNEGVVTTDISSLDPGDENPQISGWGGLSGFSGSTAEAVGDALAVGTAKAAGPAPAGASR